METKECRRCKEIKPVGMMKRDGRNSDNYSSFCKACHQAASVEWQNNNRDRMNETRRARRLLKAGEINEQRRATYDSEAVRWERRWTLYRVRKEWYDTTWAAQGGGCAICGATEGSQKRAMAIDHDHGCCPTTPTCGKCNRGILCHKCNTSLHAVESADDWIHRAVKYLNKNRAEKTWTAE